MKKENWATDLLTNLAKIYADDVDVLEIIEDTIDVYGNYVAYVYKMESLRTILKIRLEAEEYKNIKNHLKAPLQFTQLMV